MFGVNGHAGLCRGAECVIATPGGELGRQSTITATQAKASSTRTTRRTTTIPATTAARRTRSSSTGNSKSDYEDEDDDPDDGRYSNSYNRFSSVSISVNIIRFIIAA